MADEEGLDLLHKQMEFSGCKIALLCDDKLLTILRDDISTIPWPNMWELPGGGRENEETPIFMVGTSTQEECASIVFGDEGQAYQMMDIRQFLADKKVIPQLQDRLRDYLEVRA